MEHMVQLKIMIDGLYNNLYIYDLDILNYFFFFKEEEVIVAV